MKGLLKSNIRFHGRRYLATGLAVSIAVAFVVACLALANAAGASSRQLFSEQYQGAAAAVHVKSEEAPPMDGDQNHPLASPTQLINDLEALPEVGTVGASSWNYLEYIADGEKTTGSAATVLPEPLRQANYREGTAPTGEGQIALDSRTAQILKAKVGDQIEIREAASEGATVPVQVVGIYGAKANAIINMSMDSATMTIGALESLGFTPQIEGLYVSSANGSVDSATQTAVANAINQKLGADSLLEAKTVDTIIDEGMEQIDFSTAQMSLVLMIFPVIAIIVAIIVISTTFEVIVQQRQRELALLRCLGASSGQVRRLILGESIAVGAVASLLGVVAGTLLAAFGVSFVGLLPGFLPALQASNWVTMVGVFLVGIVITMVAGARPAFRMAKASPLSALNPVTNEVKRRGTGWWVRLVLGSIVAGGAGAAMVWASRQGTDTGFLIALLTGIVCLFGTILLLSAVFPPVVVLVATPFRTMLMRMAAGNSVRNPGRTSATGVSIVIGVTLIVMMMVGAGSLRVTMNTTLDASIPADILIRDESGTITPEQVKQIQGVEGLSKVEAQRGLSFDTGATFDGETVMVTDVEPLAGVARTDLAVPQGNEVFVYDADDLVDGQTYPLCLGTVCQDVVAKKSTWIGDPAEVGVNSDMLDKLGGDPQIIQVAAQLREISEHAVATSDITRIDDKLQVGGAAPMRAMFDMIINIVLSVVIALLGVSVLVSLVGVSNTLSLSVAERTRENGLLRALGMTKGQVAAMLTVEAIFIAVTAALLGSGLGIFFGWIGMVALPLGIENVIIAIPWLQVGIVIAVAIVAAVLASWLPGRRAARTSPVEALASE